MKKKTALITGISGMDGSHLADLLLEKDYEVFGTRRRVSTETENLWRIKHIENKLNLRYADMLDYASLERVFQECQPDEVYHLAAQSHVRVSFDQPLFTVQNNCMGIANILEIIRNNKRNTKFYFAGSSEMFGRNCDEDGYQRETTPFAPVSVYGCSKVFGYNLTEHYKHAYDIFACSGVLFNHESPRRGDEFVTQKIIKAAKRIKAGQQDILELGNLNACRDWGYAGDYVEAMWMMLQHPTPDNYVVATGETHSVQEFLELVFQKLDLDIEKYVKINSNLYRAEELKFLKGDASKAKKILGWFSKYNLKNLIENMLNI